MIAYNETWLKNLFIQHEATEAFENNCITKEERDQVLLQYPASFYTPNLFIRTGLFILTTVIMLFSFGLLVLISLNGGEHFIFTITIFFSVLAYVALEYMIKRKKHYQSGVDDALLWGAAMALFFGISLQYDLTSTQNCIIIFLISSFNTLRYADRLMAAISFISFAAILFFECLNAGGILKSFLPFIVMAISFLVYFVTGKLNRILNFNVYADCLNVLDVVSLLTLYVAGNYFVVRELNNSMFKMNPEPGQSIPFGWLFWIFTCSIPVLYIARGIQKKDGLLMRTGLVLVAAMVFTIRYYHAVLPVETAMIIGGIPLIIFAWWLSRYLSIPKYGFTSVEETTVRKPGISQVESLILAETFSALPQQTGDTKFGGGSFGGGGASGDF